MDFWPWLVVDMPKAYPYYGRGQNWARGYMPKACPYGFDERLDKIVMTIEKFDRIYD
ncbi:MAG: hypothetical protein NC102_06910 [Clostridium sp.]|nr:hypothetical protein [Clostridium sp.]